MNSFDYVSSKLGGVRSETRSIARELYDAARANGHEIWFMWGMGSSTEHSSGTALDLMVRNRAGGDFVRNYIWRHRKRLRLRHVIWWQKITSTVVQPGVVRQMADRGNSTVNHKDHVHVWFYRGAYRAPQVEPAPVSGIVRTIQRRLEVVTDGKWGPKTDERALLLRRAARSKSGWPSSSNVAFDVRTVQGVIDTKVDGDWGPNSQGALEGWIKGFQATLGVKVDGLWGPKTDAKFISVRRQHLNNY